MKKKEMVQIATWIAQALDHKSEPKVLAKIHADVKKFCAKFPLYKDHAK
jgi:glycine/serine hydroxymethyltransferase